MGDVVDIQASGRHIGSHQDIHLAAAELLHHPVPLVLAQVPVEAFRLVATGGQGDDQFVHTLFGAAEDDHLAVVGGVQDPAQAVHFVPGFIVVLVDGGSRHHFLVDGHHLGSPHVFLADAQDGPGHGGGKQHGLPFRGNVLDDVFHIVHKAHIQHFIGFIQHQEVHVFQVDGAPADMVQQPARSPDDHLDAPFQAADLPFDGLAAVHRKYPDPFGLADLADFVRHLDAQFPGGAHDQGLDVPVLFIDLLDDGDPESRGLAGTGLGLADQVLPFQGHGNGAFLDGGRFFKAHFLQGCQDLPVQVQVFERRDFRLGFRRCIFHFIDFCHDFSL